MVVQDDMVRVFDPARLFHRYEPADILRAGRNALDVSESTPQLWRIGLRPPIELLAVECRTLGTGSHALEYLYPAKGTLPIFPVVIASRRTGRGEFALFTPLCLLGYMPPATEDQARAAFVDLQLQIAAAEGSLH